MYLLQSVSQKKKKKKSLHVYGSRGFQWDLVHSVNFCDLWVSRIVVHEYVGKHQQGRCYTS